MVEVHKFICSRNHEFYLPLHLPRPIAEVGELLKTMCCPICQDNKLSMDFAVGIVVSTVED